MTVLDHSSVHALLRDLRLHRGGEFRFESPSGRDALPPWRFVAATGEDGCCFRLCVEHPSSPCAVVYECCLWHRNLHLAGTAGLWVAAAVPPPDPDVPLRRRLYENLKGVFS